MSQKCPKCGSQNVKMEGDDFFSYLICSECGFDESLEYETDMGDRKTKSSGGSPYKRGGSLRTQKR